MWRKLRLAGLALITFSASIGFGASPFAGFVKDTSGVALNGVFVSAKREGSTYSVTVYSDDAGRFRFPELASGTYTITAHAGGFQSRNSKVAVKDGQTVPLDFTLGAETNPVELLKQATASEWLASLPGTEKQKYALNKNCGSCHHNLYQLRDYHFTKSDWSKIITVMGRIDVIGELRGRGPHWRDGSEEDMAEYLELVQGPISPLPKIRFFPQAAGKATQAIITEYRIPRENAVPHDVMWDGEGNAWYNDFKTDYLGKLNAKTGEFKEYKMPSVPRGPHPGSSNMFIGEDHNVWMNQRNQDRFIRFDPRTEKVIGLWNHVRFIRVDMQRGVALGTDMQMDLKTGQVLRYKYKSSTSGYESGHAMNSQGMIYKGGIEDGVVRLLNPETGAVINYPTPTPDAGPRRTSLDWEENLWFGEWYGGKIGRLNTKTGKITEYTPAVPFPAFYQAGVDLKNHMGWSFDWRSDRLVRVNPKTGEITEFPMPTLDVEGRWTAVDTTTDPPSVWIPGAGNGLIIRVQAPL